MLRKSNFRCRVGIPVFNAVFLDTFWEYCRRLDSSVYIFRRRLHFDVVDPEAANFGEMT